VLKDILYLKNYCIYLAALEMLVENHVTGLPVVDEENVVVGIISDFDLLCLEGVSEEEKKGGLFPTADDDWNSFFEVQKLVEKNAGKTYAWWWFAACCSSVNFTWA